MTLDELKAIENPLAHYQQGADASNKDFVGIAQASVEDLATQLGKWLNHFAQAFAVQNQELALLRTLEHYCRADTLTPENLAELIGKLDAFRTDLLNKIKQASETQQA